MLKRKLLTTAIVAITGSAHAKQPVNIGLEQLGTYQTGVFAEGAAEIVAYDDKSQQLFVINANAKTDDVLDISDPRGPVLAGTVEQVTALALPDDFNSTNDKTGSFDDRSDGKGPEPEGVVVGKLQGRQFAFVGLERIGGVMIFDVTDPDEPRYVSYTNNRDFLVDAEDASAGDLGPEGLLFIKRGESPIHEPLLLVGNEVSGSTTIYQVVEDCFFVAAS